MPTAAIGAIINRRGLRRKENRLIFGQPNQVMEVRETLCDFPWERQWGTSLYPAPDAATVRVELAAKGNEIPGIM